MVKPFVALIPRALLLAPLFLAVLLGPAFASAAPTCENSSLAADVAMQGHNVEPFAEALANFRVSIRQMPEGEAKSTAAREFEAKFAEFVMAVGHRDQALSWLQRALKKIKVASSPKNILESERMKKQLEEQTHLFSQWTKYKELPNISGREIKDLRITADGSKLVTVERLGNVKILDFNTKKETVITNEFAHLLTPDGLKSISIGSQQVEIMDLNNMHKVKVHFETKLLKHMSVTHDGSKLVTCDHDGVVKILDLKTLKEIDVPYSHPSWVNSSSMTPDGSKIVTAGEHGEIKMFDLKTLREINVPYQHSKKINHILITPDGSKLVSVGHGGEVKMLDLLTMQEIRVPYEHTDAWVQHSLVTPDSSKLVTVGSEGGVKMLNLQTMQEIKVPYKHTSAVFHSSVTPDGSQLITVGYREVKRLNLVTMEEMLVPYSHKNPVLNSLVSPDGSKIVTSDMDGNRVIWFRDPMEAELWD